VVVPHVHVHLIGLLSADSFDDDANPSRAKLDALAAA
jgi:diadenosine tetraphosphate (Ap4A) HIT family hydrolase